jgi:hypothetical protein
MHHVSDAMDEGLEVAELAGDLGLDGVLGLVLLALPSVALELVASPRRSGALDAEQSRGQLPAPRREFVRV